jgi:hypothetical protein
MLTRANTTPAPTGRRLARVALTLVLGFALTAGAIPASASAPATSKAGATPVSVQTAAKVAKFSKTVAPVVTGTVKVGKPLAVKTGTWAPKPASFSYQWKRAGMAIAGATRSTYVLRPADADRAVTVTVTAKRPGYAAAARQSASTRQVVGLAYKNCAALVKDYPHGVAKAGTKSDKVSGQARPLEGPPFFSTAVYNLNTKSDRDRDDIACER